MLLLAIQTFDTRRMNDNRDQSTQISFTFFLLNHFNGRTSFSQTCNKIF
ncbi:uncharacterized protein J3R85_014464 [Psidium guajava]|nr:uncharacterized protein J3R85_014464 [Psidium guajava]